MQTVYFTTKNYIRHEGNLVDLCRYRERLERVQAVPDAGAGNVGVLPAMDAPRGGSRLASRRRSPLRRVFATADFLATCGLIALILLVAVKLIVG